jgi:hypothetical protein
LAKSLDDSHFGSKKQDILKKKKASKPFRLLQLALVGCKDGRSSQAAFCHQNVWLNIFVAKVFFLSLWFCLGRKGSARKQISTDSGGPRFYKVKLGPKIKVAFQAQFYCTWIRSLLFNKKRNVCSFGKFFALWGPRKIWNFLLF